MVVHPFFELIRFGSEFLYTFLVVFLCFLIYFKTRESYILTKHKGIKYFRDAFLFFGLSYALRLLFSIIMFSDRAFDLDLPRLFFFPPLLLFPVGYFSTIGIFYLLFSSLWKEHKTYLLISSHLVAVLLSAVALFTRSYEILFDLQSVLLVVAVILSFITHRKVKKIPQIKIFYILILIFWLFNLWAMEPRGLFHFGMKLILQAASLVVFIIIYHRVTKWAK